MVENQTERLELVGSTNRDEPSFMDTQTGGSIGNPPPPPLQVRRKGRVPTSSSQTATFKPKRKTYKCGVCGAEGHNKKSCQFREEACLNSQLEEMEMIDHVDEDYANDIEDCNIDVVSKFFI